MGVWAVRHGFNAVNITYRLAPRFTWPSGIEDIRAAIRWIQENAVGHGLDADRIFLAGQSAGATHAAGYLAHQHIYAPEPHGLRGLILLSGIYNFTGMPISEREKAYLGSDTSAYQTMSSLKGLAQANVPMLVSLTEFDPFYFEAQTLELLSAVQKERLHMPCFVYQIGQNHLSGILYLGITGDLLGPQLEAFIEEHGRGLS